MNGGWHDIYCTENRSVFTAGGRLYQRKLDNYGFETDRYSLSTDAVDDFISDMGTVHAEKDMSPTPGKFNRT